MPKLFFQVSRGVIFFFNFDTVKLKRFSEIEFSVSERHGWAIARYRERKILIIPYNSCIVEIVIFSRLE